jgi:hypothetical protein
LQDFQNTLPGFITQDFAEFYNIKFSH